jgi:hypothetical protein
MLIIRNLGCFIHANTKKVLTRILDSTTFAIEISSIFFKFRVFLKKIKERSFFFCSTPINSDVGNKLNVELWKFEIIIFSDNYFKVSLLSVLSAFLCMFVCYHKKVKASIATQLTDHLLHRFMCVLHTHKRSLMIFFPDSDIVIYF